MKKKTKLETSVVELEEKLKLEKESHEKTSQLFMDSVSQGGKRTSEIMELKDELAKLEKAVIVNFIKVNTLQRTKGSGNVYTINT